MDPIVMIVMVVALVAAYPGWLMYQKAFYTTPGWFRVLTVLFCLLLPPLIAASCFIIPFAVSQGKEMPRGELFTDFVIYGMCPAALIALLAWVADSIADRERPRRALMAGAALFAIVLLPIAFHFYADQAVQRFEIKLKEDSATNG